MDHFRSDAWKREAELLLLIRRKLWLSGRLHGYPNAGNVLPKGVISQLMGRRNHDALSDSPRNGVVDFDSREWDIGR